ncbi:MAG: hypothetical protein WDZ85_02320 [Candidatus Paceibacterota bacterium]
MTTLHQSDFFINFLGVSQIFIAVFLVFILALLVKILSDIAFLTRRFKREVKETAADLAEIRSEAKDTIKSLVAYVATFIGAVGVRRAMGFLAGWLEQSTSKRRARSGRKTKTSKSAETKK